LGTYCCKSMRGERVSEIILYYHQLDYMEALTQWNLLIAGF
jgi:hypothetical protein